MAEKVNIVWFRRDLRLDDNVGFYKALHGKFPVIPIFIFDSEILNELPKDDARLTFIFETLQKMRTELQEQGSSIALYHGKPEQIFKQIISEFDVQNVITNRDYEPYAKKRDAQIETLLAEKEIGFYTFKDQVIFEKDEVVKNDGDPYIVYTPYMKIWKEKYKKEYDSKIYYTNEFLKNLYQNSRLPNLSMNDIGFKKSKIEIPEYDVTPSTIQEYEKRRNFPAEDATSHLGPHLRFGTVSIRKMIKKQLLNKTKFFGKN